MASSRNKADDTQAGQSFEQALEGRQGSAQFGRIRRRHGRRRRNGRLRPCRAGEQQHRNERKRLQRSASCSASHTSNSRFSSRSGCC